MGRFFNRKEKPAFSMPYDKPRVGKVNGKSVVVLGLNHPLGKVTHEQLVPKFRNNQEARKILLTAYKANKKSPVFLNAKGNAKDKEYLVLGQPNLTKAILRDSSNRRFFKLASVADAKILMKVLRKEQVLRKANKSPKAVKALQAHARKLEKQIVNDNKKGIGLLRAAKRDGAMPNFKTKEEILRGGAKA